MLQRPDIEFLAVWITEDVRPTHLAAVDFLNRVAAAEASTFGMVLLRVMFAAAPVGWHVHFEVESEPNAFLKVRPPYKEPHETSAARGEFIEGVVALLDGPLVQAGFRRSGGINRKHGAAVYRTKLRGFAKVTSRICTTLVAGLHRGSRG